MKWVVQTNFGKDSGIEHFLNVLKTEHADVDTFEYLSHSETLPPFQNYPPHQTFLYGSTRIIELAAEHPQWKDTVFFDPNAFSYTSWAKHYDSLLLNDPRETQQMTMGEFVQKAHEFQHLEYLFVRPNLDLKEFNGGVWSYDEFLRWAQDVVNSNYATVSKDTEIVISPPHGIDAEWRLFMQNNGEVLAHSQYKHRGKMCLNRAVPQEVLDKASDIAKIWSPAPLFTLDLAASGTGIWIVEAQSIHSSGFYDADLHHYVRGVEHYFQSLDCSHQRSKPI